ncbi:proline-rich protein PRCC-like isoform X2 [Dendronephthya gigantea]|uniref:proline-rich protein PRCC-like isoform X2 n=1 Tax=Dendronephthya gigantea TaxID=151771 RepID=UPI00106BFF1E|nr:proline-rich protein PRCC-like isoform X2 [Dendronephthya gigantea]
MSLVSYADSDDSGEEDISEPEVKKNPDKIKDKEPKPGATNFQTTETRASVGQSKLDDSFNDDKTKPKSIGSLFSSLPAPWMSTASWTAKSSAKIPKARAGQTVKIALPRLTDNSDSDDEDCTRKGETPAVASQKPSGLFSLLPKPRHSVVVKENNPNRPVTKISNRPLIPDSLRRKQAKKPSPQVKKQKTQAKKDDSDDDSGDDDDNKSFFSWSEKETSEQNEASTSQVASDAVSSVKPEQVEERSITSTEDLLPSTTTPPDNRYSIHSGLSKSAQEKIKNTENIQTSAEAALVSTIDTNPQSNYFENQNSYPDNAAWGYSYQGASDSSQYSGYQTNPENTGYPESNYPYYDQHNSQQYNQNMADQQPNYPEAELQTHAQPTVQETPEQFKRFLGKRGRGEESIDIIDVNADDQVGSSQDWKTNYQKEDIDYKPQSKKKGNLPSSQQRRKHQITYLAFQAKEKEWELRNQWSANRQTKRQTQSKYGF